jgi:hypothetical protein
MEGRRKKMNERQRRGVRERESRDRKEDATTG